MLWHYQHLLRLASGDLSQVNPDNIKFPEKISFAVISDLSRTFTRTDPLKPISDYARRVSQAGQLAVPIITPIK